VSRAAQRHAERGLRSNGLLHLWLRGPPPIRRNQIKSVQSTAASKSGQVESGMQRLQLFQPPLVIPAKNRRAAQVAF
jgi:hypothetical protein